MRNHEGMPTTAKLYVFPISHYCEKARWILDHKGIPYQTINLMPGYHVPVIKKLGSATTVPLLVIENQNIQGSDHIAKHLESSFPARPLWPNDAKDKELCDFWQKESDKKIGPHLRRFAYHHMLKESPKEVLTRFTENQEGFKKALYPYLFPVVKALMKKGMNINAKTAEKSLLILRNMIETLNKEYAAKKYLVGNRFTIADLTASALLAPMVRPEKHPMVWPQSFPDALQKEIDRQENSATFSAVRRMYHEHR